MSSITFHDFLWRMTYFLLVKMDFGKLVKLVTFQNTSLFHIEMTNGIASSCSRVREPRYSHRDSGTPGELWSSQWYCGFFMIFLRLVWSSECEQCEHTWKTTFMEILCHMSSMEILRSLTVFSGRPKLGGGLVPPSARELSRPPQDGVTGRVWACHMHLNIEHPSHRVNSFDPVTNRDSRIQK